VCDLIQAPALDCRREAPERALALALFLLGVSYVFYQVPMMLESESLWAPLSLAGRIACGASCLMMAVFTRQVFRRGEAWATGMVWAVALLLVT
jgi:protein-S-isoprenylcysteine O-methyltransferase Ste14